ncbi:MAG: MgtC/SapB family protein [Actinomycetota bacterium]|nr:MgtC/SapB family protein [Actinomycetota bacterium]
MPSELALLARVTTGFMLAFLLGFERELRGSPAGVRTFALVGTGTAAITAVTLQSSPQAVAGAITGIGFIGAGVVFHGQGELVRGLTTAAAVFATAAIGVVVGSGRLLLGAVTGAIALLTLELRYVKRLGVLDPRRYQDRFRSDVEPPELPGDDRPRP